MNKKLSIIFTAMLAAGCAQQTPSQMNIAENTTASVEQKLSVVQAIPLPSEMEAKVITNARVSTIEHIDVSYVGKQVPFTYSHGKVTNTDGFEWYVSKHFALKTDYPAERAKFFLELLELSYPYYVEYFGMEPPNIDNQRIASTYATSNDRLRDAMFDDGFNRGIHHTAGGEAMYYNWVGYSFPTERPQHQRYISIHETMHSYQMALGNYPWTPSWHGEGLGDSTANHVFDSEKKQLAVFGHDVPIFDMMSWALYSYNKDKPTIVEIHNRKRFDRGLNVLFVQFMYNNPEYSQYMKIYAQEVTRRQTASRAESLEVLQSIVPDWQLLEDNFAKWVGEIEQTHEVASRGQWEMDGNMFYKRASNYHYGPQRLGFTMTPAETPSYRPYAIDFPLPDASDLLLPIKRGVEEPTLGFVVSYQANSIDKGQLGMAFGAKSTAENLAAKKDYRMWKNGNTDLDEQLRVEIKAGNTLVLDLRNFGGELSETALPSDIVHSLAKQTKPMLGVSVQMKKSALLLTLKTASAAPYEYTQPLNAQQRENLVNRSFGLVSTDNQHGITPYMDDGRNLNPNKPDYSKNTATNAWGFSGDKLAQRFARAIWKAGKSTPDSWRAAFSQLNGAALTPKTAEQEIAAVKAMLPSLMKDGANLNEAKAELSGVALQLDWLGASPSDLKEYAIITNYSDNDINGTITFNVDEHKSKVFEVVVKANDKSTLLIPADLLSKGKVVAADFNYNWQGFDISQKLTQKTVQYRGFELPKISANYADNNLTVTAHVNGPFSGKTEGQITFDLYHGKEKESHAQKLSMQPYEEQVLSHQFNIDEKSVDHDAWYEVTVVADVDGEPITVRKRLPYIPAKFNR